MSAAVQYPLLPERYRSLQTLLLLSVLGSVLGSLWLMPSRLERVTAATERGDQALIERELDRASVNSVDPGETRALVDVALTLGKPDIAASILDQALTQHTDSLDAMRLLLEVQRQRHRMTDVASLDERIFAQTGEAEALREAADIYASQRRTTQRVDALQRLNALGQATAADMSELSHRMVESGAGPAALDLLLKWLETRSAPLPSEIVALAASLSVARPDAATTATALGRMIGRADGEGTFNVLIQTYAERGRPELSVVAGHALGSMQTRPDVALVLAQLDALQGDFSSARRRLDDLDRAGKLLPAGLPMLADLSLQVGDLTRAASLIAALPPGQIAEGLPQRFVEAAYAAGQLNVVTRLSVDRIASVSPGSAAVIALARGDRVQATALAQAVLGPGGDLGDLGPAFGDVIRALGLTETASARLLAIARNGALADNELGLLLDIAMSSRTTSPALLQMLRARRDSGPRAGMVWASLVAQQGGAAEVAAWLPTHATAAPTASLIELLVVGAQKSNPALARAAASALAGRSDLSNGWTSAEIAFTAHGTDPLTPARMRDGLALIGAAQSPPASRDRIVALLVDNRDFARVALAFNHVPDGDEALSWLAGPTSGNERSELAAARLTLLEAVAPQRSLEPLETAWTADPKRLAPLYVAALLRTGRTPEAQRILAEELQGLAPKQQDATLQDILARVPRDDGLVLLRVGARSGREDWVAAYQEALTRAGLLDELRSDLRARGAVSSTEMAQRQAIASRLVDLNDRVGAISILKTIATGLRPNSPSVEQLLYLWGPRANSDAIAWARGQAAAAPLADLPLWLDHLAYLAAPRAVLDLVGSRPAVLGSSAPAVRSYGAALIAADVTAKPDLGPAIASASGPDQLTALIQLALDTGQAPSAWRASEKALSIAPNSQAILRLAAQASAAVRRSDEAASLYARLLALGPEKPEIMIDAADAFMTAKRVASGRQILARVLDTLPPEPSTLAQARLRVRALVLLHQDDKAIALLQGWLTRYPNHAGLQADLIQARHDTVQ